ncbi:response regulator transcription factor [Acidipropionibacterium timonense]|uniref:response regulator transcription factor n=1 Tax=Acidipropionibacterium timonense TaxID=2161818 RepID=UPI00103022E9|nr:response regulator transcription factor [Acidipropionibacterium timonense]
MRVLVVEDEAPMADAVRRGLEAEGFVVDTAPDGIVGQYMALHEDYDVVVLDIMLPGRNGYDVLKDMRAHKVWTPVLMLTAKDGEYDQTDAFDLGADDYLTKPFSFPVLVARLRALQRRGAPERPVVLEVGSLRLDPVRHAVERLVGGDAATISLTAKEFTLLEFLMRHPDEVLSKATILDSVWDSAYSGGDNIVEVYMGYLRRKIDAPFGVHTLLTVRGAGYQLVSDSSSGPSSVGRS